MSPTILKASLFAVAVFVCLGAYAYVTRPIERTITAQSTSQKTTDSQENTTMSDTQEQGGDQSETDTKKTQDPNITKTQAIADQVFETYYARKEFGSYSKEDAQKIVDVATQNALDHTVRQFKEADILEDQAVTTDSIIAYKTAVKNALEPVFAIPEYELQTYAHAAEKNDPKEFQKLKAYALAYSGSVEALLKIHAPVDATPAHLALINAFTKMAYALTEMSKGYDDVIGSFSALKVFAEGEQDVEIAFGKHKTYFFLHNIPTQ